MAKVKNNPQNSLQTFARDYCSKIGAEEIYNIADLGENDVRIMYWIKKDDVRKMEALILKAPSF